MLIGVPPCSSLSTGTISNLYLVLQGIESSFALDAKYASFCQSYGNKYLEADTCPRVLVIIRGQEAPGFEQGVPDSRKAKQNASSLF
jgi:hypothetical protein